MARPLLILNPDAGSVREDPRLLTNLRAHPALDGVDLAPSDGPEAVRSLAREAREEGREGLLVGGGDGTIHHAVNGLLDGLDPDALPPRESLPALGVIPMGTGNDLARSLGIPSDPWKAVEGLDWNEVRALDLIRTEGAGDPWCVNVVTGGLATPGAGGEEGDQKGAPGVLAYWRRGVEAVKGGHPSYRLEVVLGDGETHELSAQNVVVANGRYVAGGIPVAPRALLDDGRLDLLVVPDLDLAEMVLLFPRLLVGKHPEHDALLARKAERIEIRSHPDLDLSLDGEGARAGELVFRAVPAVLNVLMGPDDPGAFQGS